MFLINKAWTIEDIQRKLDMESQGLSFSIGFRKYLVEFVERIVQHRIDAYRLIYIVQKVLKSEFPYKSFISKEIADIITDAVPQTLEEKYTKLANYFNVELKSAITIVKPKFSDYLIDWDYNGTINTIDKDYAIGTFSIFDNDNVIGTYSNIDNDYVIGTYSNFDDELFKNLQNFSN